MKNLKARKKQRKFLLRNWLKLSAYAYKQYLQKGRGAVIIRSENPDFSREESVNLENLAYLHIRKLKQIAEELTPSRQKELICNYFPEKAVVAAFVLPDGRTESHFIVNLPTPVQGYFAAIKEEELILNIKE